MKHGPDTISALSSMVYWLPSKLISQDLLVPNVQDIERLHIDAKYILIIEKEVPPT
jgi:hypothetical protein